MFRKFYRTLENWENHHIKEPLMVTGARQVGKTWIIREFCKNKYPDYVYANLEENRDLRSAFDGNLNPETVIGQMEMILGRKIGPDIPIFIDEIQYSERAVTCMKYFCEAEENYRIICAGSLLGVKLQRFESSFPVGKVRIAGMYPMDFEEFLIASGEDLLRDGIRSAYEAKSNLADGVHMKALRLYHDYLFTGGMPQVVLNYIDNGKKIVAMDPQLQANLRLAYLADMTKYVTSPAESVKITEVYNSVPRQLARENPKFKYSTVKKGANKRDFAGPLDWLAASGMIYKINSLDRPEIPLKGFENPDHFKIYLSDVGILTNMCGLHYNNLLPESDSIYKGGVIENYVIQQMILRHPELYYYKPSDSMEVDLVFDDGGNAIPVEIKSGRHKRSTSLRNYCNKVNPAYAIRFSELNFGWTDTLRSIPLYAAFCV